MVKEKLNGVEVDLAVDFMDMTDDRRLLTRVADARTGFVPRTGIFAVVGDDDADPRVAKIISVGSDGVVELLVLAGSVESHRDLLVPG